MKNPVIQIENVSWAYSPAKIWALKDISLEIEEGAFVAVLGGNGSGKTTFCRLLNGLIPHSLAGKLTGRVMVDGIDTASSSPALLAEKTGMAFEEPQLFTARVFDEVAFALENMLLPPAQIKEKVLWALDAVSLRDYAELPPISLSSGQKQRLAIAAAAAMAGRVLVLDDPTSQLDPLGAGEILSLINELRGKTGLTVVMTACSGEDAAEYADKICVLNKGSIAAFDIPRNIFSDRKLFADSLVQSPAVSECALCMENLGHALPEFPVNLREAEEAVISWYNSGEKCG